MTMKRWVILLVCLVSGWMAYGQSANNVLAQLGVKGVTDKIYGTNAALYAGYLIKTGTNGLFDISPFPAGVRPIAANKLFYVDSVVGVDSTNTVGSITAPYKTLHYAISNAIDGYTLVLAPGAYTGPTVTNTAINNLTIVGCNATGTVVSGTLTFNSAVNDINLQVRGLTLTDIKQNQYRHLTVSLLDGARVTGMIYRQYPTSVNSVLVVQREPNTLVGTPISSVNSTNILLFQSEFLGYTPSSTNDWQTRYSIIPSNVLQALDKLVNGYVVYTNNPIPSDFVPSVDMAYRLGSPSYRWSEIHGGKLSIWSNANFNGSVASNVYGLGISSNPAAGYNWIDLVTGITLLGDYGAHPNMIDATALGSGMYGSFNKVGTTYGSVMRIGPNAYGAMIRGQAYGEMANATNNAIGSIQLINLIAGEVALMTGNASIGLGACTVSNDQAIVAGNGGVSHGNGSITAQGGFYGSGVGLANVPYGQVYLFNNDGSFVTNYGSNVSNALAVATNGQVVYIGAGTYLLSGMSTVSNGVRITGASRHSTVLQSVGNLQPMLDPQSGVFIENLTVNGTTANSYPIIGTSTTNLVVRNCTLRSSASPALSLGVSGGANSYVQIYDSYLEGLSGIEVTTVGGSLSVFNSIFQAVGSGGMGVYLDPSPSFNALFESCTVYGSDVYAFGQLTGGTSVLNRCTVEQGIGGTGDIGNYVGANTIYEFGCKYRTSGGIVNHTNLWCITPSDSLHTANKGYVDMFLPTNGTVSMAGNLTPAVSNNYDLGSNSYPWRSLYLSNTVFVLPLPSVAGAPGTVYTNSSGALYVSP